MVVGRPAVFAKRRQSVAAGASRPGARRPQHPPRPKIRPQSAVVHHNSPEHKTSEAEASTSSATTTGAPLPSAVTRPRLSTDSQLGPAKRKDATARRSTDFSNIVLEAARRASATSHLRRGTAADSDIEAATGSDTYREKRLKRQPSIEEVAETESTVSVGSLLAKQHSLLENSPRRRR